MDVCKVLEDVIEDDDVESLARLQGRGKHSHAHVCPTPRGHAGDLAVRFDANRLPPGRCRLAEEPAVGAADVEQAAAPLAQPVQNADDSPEVSLAQGAQPSGASGFIDGSGGAWIADPYGEGGLLESTSAAA
jgi:hypothetical protein